MTQNSETPPLIRISVFARLMQCSRQSVQTAIKEGRITTRRVAGMTLILLDDRTKSWTPNVANILKGKLAVLQRRKNPVKPEVAEKVREFTREIQTRMKTALDEQQNGGSHGEA